MTDDRPQDGRDDAGPEGSGGATPEPVSPWAVPTVPAAEIRRPPQEPSDSPGPEPLPTPAATSGAGSPPPPPPPTEPDDPWRRGASVAGGAGWSGAAAAAASGAAAGAGVGASHEPDASGGSGASEPPRKRRTGRLVLAALGLTGVIAGGAFAYTQITGGEQANTPEEAVESLYRSLETGDVIGLARALAPGERDIMFDSMIPMVEELSRLEILDRDVDLEKVPGFSATLTEFAATSKLLRDDVAAVTVTKGSISTRIDPDKLPIGPFLRDLLGDQIDDADPLTDTSTISGDENDPIVVQKVGKRWYVSLNYSVAATNRSTLPAKGSGVPAKGSATPEAAVTDMLTAMADLDVRRMIELMPPDELPALHDLAGEFIGDAEDAVKDAKDFYDLSLRPELRTTKLSGDRTLVSIVDLPMDLSVDAEGNTFQLAYAKRALNGTLELEGGERATFEGDLTKRTFAGKLVTPAGENLSATFADDCLALDLDGDTKRGCGNEEIASIISELVGTEISAEDLSGTGAASGAQCRPATPRPKASLGFVTVRRDGLWYVSPTRTMLDSMTASLKQLDRASLDCLRDELEKQLGDLGGLAGLGANAEPDPGLGDSTFDPPTTEGTLDTLPEDFDTIPADTRPVDTVPAGGDAPPDTVEFSPPS